MALMASYEQRPKLPSVLDSPTPAEQSLDDRKAPALSSQSMPPASSKYQNTDEQSETASTAGPNLFSGYVYPTTVSIGSERVQVNSEQEAAEARGILAAIESEATVEVSSQKGVAALRQRYDQLPEALKAQVRTDVWQLKELRALHRALLHFAPLLGQQRKESNARSIPQQVISVSKLHESATENSPMGRLDGNEEKRTAGVLPPRPKFLPFFRGHR